MTPRPGAAIWPLCVGSLFSRVRAWVGEYLQSSPPFADSGLALFLQDGFRPRRTLPVIA